MLKKEKNYWRASLLLSAHLNLSVILQSPSFGGGEAQSLVKIFWSTLFRSTSLHNTRCTKFRIGISTFPLCFGRFSQALRDCGPLRKKLELSEIFEAQSRTGTEASKISLTNTNINTFTSYHLLMNFSVWKQTGTVDVPQQVRSLKPLTVLKTHMGWDRGKTAVRLARPHGSLSCPQCCALLVETTTISRGKPFPFEIKRGIFIHNQN